MMNNEISVPNRLMALERGIEKILAMLELGSPVLDLIPGVAPVIAGVEAVGHIADDVLRQIDNDPLNNVDTAALAANQISKSTGNEVVDMRLAAVEAMLNAALPVLKMVVKHFGVDTSILDIAPTPMKSEAV